MKRQYHRWHSSRLGFELGVVVYGHWGPPLLGFPTSAGDEWEPEGQSMVGALSDFIDAGHALALELPLVAGTGRKTEERRPPVSINDNAKFEAQARRMPAMVLTLHVECPFEPRERSIRAAQGSGQCNCSSKRERRTAGL